MADQCVESDPGLTGDANGDGRVDINDLTVVLTNYGKTAGTSWDTGDFNGDGRWTSTI